MMQAERDTEQQLAICLRNDGYEASLEVRKVYSVLSDAVAVEHGMIRVIDESGEDYLYPRDYFIGVELPQSVKEALFLTV